MCDGKPDVILSLCVTRRLSAGMAWNGFPVESGQALICVSLLDPVLAFCWRLCSCGTFLGKSSFGLCLCITQLGISNVLSSFINFIGHFFSAVFMEWSLHPFQKLEWCDVLQSSQIFQSPAWHSMPQRRPPILVLSLLLYPSGHLPQQITDTLTQVIPAITYLCLLGASLCSKCLIYVCIMYLCIYEFIYINSFNSHSNPMRLELWLCPFYNLRLREVK